MDEEDTLIATAVLLLMTAAATIRASQVQKRKRRRYKVRPVNRQRKTMGHYDTLVKTIKQIDHEQYFKYTRLMPNQFDHLLSLVGPHLTKMKAKNPISPGCRLTMTLHYLAEGCSMQQIAWDFYVGKTTVHRVIKETCEVLWTILAPIYLPVPDKKEWLSIAEGFYKRWNMPNCISALDGKHILIQAPQHSGTDYFNYKRNFSVVLMAMCDAYYRFTVVDIGGYGSHHDSSIFKTSAMGNAFLQDQLDFPDGIELPGTTDVLPYFAVADQAFPLHHRIMRPYPGERLGERKNVFNYRLSRARRTIENTFGILSQRWRILRKPIVANITTVEQIIKAIVCLHNYCQRKEMDIPLLQRKYCPTGFADYVDENGQFHFGTWRSEQPLLSVGRVGSNNASAIVKTNREKLANYFISPTGSVPWQSGFVNRGALP